MAVCQSFKLYEKFQFGKKSLELPTPGQWMYASPVVGFLIIEFQEWMYASLNFPESVAECQGIQIRYSCKYN